MGDTLAVKTSPYTSGSQAKRGPPGGRWGRTGLGVQQGHVPAAALSASHINELNPHSGPRWVLLLSSFHREKPEHRVGKQLALGDTAGRWSWHLDLGSLVPEPVLAATLPRAAEALPQKQRRGHQGERPKPGQA